MRNVFILLITFIPFLSFGQSLDPNQIVKWKFSAQQVGEQSFVFTAEANITKPFHIFHTDAGGDGTLISTEFVFDNANEEDIDWKSVPAPVVKKFDVIDGDVFWHESKVAFTKTVEAEEGSAFITGEVSFQVCDDEKCLAPTTQKFKVKIKQ